MSVIVANSVLPAVREPVTLSTADGLALRGELSLPDWCMPLATVIIVHPLTTHGGSMESHLIRKAAWRLPALAGLAVLRFNMRGAGEGDGRSEGEFDSSSDEGLDLGAAIDLCRVRELPDPWLVGWSFGADVVLRHGNRAPVLGAVLLSPPLRFTSGPELERWARSGRPLVAVVPENDDYLRPDDARERFAPVPHAEVVEVAEAGHLWVGERYARRALDEVVRQVNPGAHPLPTDWDGPMERWSDL